MSINNEIIKTQKQDHIPLLPNDDKREAIEEKVEECFEFKIRNFEDFPLKPHEKKTYTIEQISPKPKEKKAHDTESEDTDMTHIEHSVSEYSVGSVSDYDTEFGSPLTKTYSTDSKYSDFSSYDTEFGSPLTKTYSTESKYSDFSSYDTEFASPLIKTSSTDSDKKEMDQPTTPTTPTRSPRQGRIQRSPRVTDLKNHVKRLGINLQ